MIYELTLWVCLASHACTPAEDPTGPPTFRQYDNYLACEFAWAKMVAKVVEDHDFGPRHTCKPAGVDL